MHRSTWSRWIKTLNGRRKRQEKSAPRRLTLTKLENRDCPTGFTAGDLVVYRVGTGSAALGTGATAVFLDQYTTAVGGFVSTPVALPTAAGTAPLTNALTAGGTTTGDGLLSTTADGRYLLVTGYDAAAGTASVTSTLPATSPRVVGLVDANGNVNTTTGLNDATSAIREAASLDGTAIYTAGSTSGGPVRLAAGGQTGSSTGISAVANTDAAAFSGAQDIGIFNGQLYTGGSAGSFNGLGTVGTGLPTTSGQLISTVPGFPVNATTNFPSPRQFVFTNSTTVYVADSNASVTNGNNYGGLQKWTLSNGVWSEAYVIPINTAGSPEGLYSLVYGGSNTFYATTSEASSNKLISIVDGGTAGSSVVTVLDTAATNEVFRGVAFAPSVTPGTTAVTSFGVVPSATSVPLNTSVTFTATVTAGTSPTGYVTFENGNTVLAIVPLTAGAGGTATAQYTTTALTGSTTLTAVYGGDTTYLKASANAAGVTVATGTATSFVSLASNNVSATVNGQAVMFTATFSGGGSAPVGSVAFYDNNVLLGSAATSASGANAVANFSVTTNPLGGAGKIVAGSHTITAVFSGVGFVGSTGTFIQSVKPNAYTQGDLVIQRIGDGTNALTEVTTDAVFLDERNPSTGALVQSIALPTTSTAGGNQALTGEQILGDGLLSDSTDGRYLLAVGYSAPAGTALLPTQPRTVGTIDSNGNVNTTTSLTDGGTGANDIRDATSPDGVGVWVSGNSSAAGGNLRFTTVGTSGTSTGISSTFGNTSVTTGINSAIINTITGQLVVDGGASGIDGPATVSTSVSGAYPTTTGQTESVSTFPGFPSTGTPFPQARQFLTPDNQTFYVADSRSLNSTTPVGFFGGLQVWTASFGTFGVGSGTNNTPNYVISPDGTNNDEGLVGITANFGNSANPIFYGVTSEFGAVPNKLVKISYNTATGVGTVTVLATAGASELFSGVAMAPTPLGTTTDTVGVQSSAFNPTTMTNNPIITGAPVSFTATVTGATTPTGYITFQQTVVGSGVTTTLGVTPLTGSGGQATAVYTSPGFATPGNVVITAIYGGDGTYVTKTGSTNQPVVGEITTTTVTQPVATPGANGTSLTFTATVKNTTNTVTPGGTVDFYDNGNLMNALGSISVSGSGNTATATLTISTNPTQMASGGFVSALTPGVHTISAIFTSTTSGMASSSTTFFQTVNANPFGAGDVLVYRVGDGLNSLHGTTGDTVYIDEYTPAAGQTTPVQSIVMPTKAQTADGGGGDQALVSAAQQSAEGQLSLSTDGQYVYLTGYDITETVVPGGNTSTDIHVSSAASIPRTIGRISYTGAIDTSMALTDVADGGDIRGVASPGGNAVYVTGTNGNTVASNGGVRYVGTYSGTTTTSTQIDTLANGSNGYVGPVPWADLFVSGGQLFATDNTYVGSGATSTNTLKVAAIGTGLPTTGGQNAALLSGIPTAVDTTADTPANYPQLPLGAFFAKLQTGPSVGPDTMYLPDEGATFFGGAITKWALVSGTWNLVDTIKSNGTTYTDPNPAFDFVNGTVSGNTVSLYATYGDGGNITYGVGDLFSLTDTGGYNAAIPIHTVTTLASVGSSGSVLSSAANEDFRGVAPVPTAPITVANVVASDGIAADGTTQRSEVRQIQVTFSGPVSFAGGNTNAAAAFQLQRVQNSANVALAAAVSTVAGQTVVTLTFSGAVTDPVSASNGASPSLADGNYQLTVLANDVSSAAGSPLAGGGAGGNYVSPLQSAFVAGQPNLFRIFGDATGNGFVDSQDLGQFRSTYNLGTGALGYLAYLDADNSGSVDSQDLGQFRSRYNNNAFA